MKTLDNHARTAKLDTMDVAGSTKLLPDQCAQAWADVKKIALLRLAGKVDNVVVNGMGGSALGAHVIRSIFGPEMKVPLYVTNSYDLPGFVGPRTLYIVSSYSGSTEEPIMALPKALKRKAKVWAIAGGSKLARAKKSKKLPGYVFDPVANPSGQPRIGVGYTMFGTLAMLKKAGLIKVSDAEVRATIAHLRRLDRKLSIDVPTAKNPAKRLAEQLHGQEVVIAASEHLAGNAHIWSNQTNESAKAFATWQVIPELNHHLLEGLSQPASIKKSMVWIFLTSKLYAKRVQARHRITADVVGKNKIEHHAFTPAGRDRLQQAFEVLQMGSYVTLYQALLSGLDPKDIPWVDYFKERLAKA